VPALETAEGVAVFSLQAKLIALVILATVLAGTHWKARQSGYKARETIALADDAKRVAAALEAEQKARVREQELTAKVGKVDRAYQESKRNTVAVAAAAGRGLRELETALARPRAAASDPATSSGVDDDPRSAILAECAGALVRLDKEARRLADQTIALQNYAIGVCVK